MKRQPEFLETPLAALLLVLFMFWVCTPHRVNYRTDSAETIGNFLRQ